MPWAKAHALGELALHRSGLRWTILRSSAFFQNFEKLKTPIRKGVLPIAAGHGNASFIDAADVAQVAARVLTEDGHDQATYHLTGPQALTMKDAAQALSDARGKHVRYIDLPVPLYRASLRLAGVDRWLRDGLVAQYAAVVAKGHDVAVTQDVQRLIGSEPKSFVTWAQEQRMKFS